MWKKLDGNKMKKIDVSKLEKVTKEDYEENLTEMILNTRKVLDKLITIYNKYEIIDKNNYILNYYRNPKNGTFLYIKDKKKKMGFIQNG